MSTPLTDSINALTTYANEVTGASDTTLSDAVHTLASGYGGGGITPSGTISITQNGTVDVTQYASANVNVPTGGGGGAVSESDVNFYDYDGTILHSYTVAEFNALTEMPSNPTHTGLTAQGWNWSLADAKAYVTKYPEAGISIGQMYITDDGKTRIYCHFTDGRLAPYLGIGVKGSVVVDWGDGSSTDTLTGTSLTAAQMVQHTFVTEGDYVITLTVSSGSFSFFGVSNAAHILKKSGGTKANVSKVYANSVQKIELGTGAGIGNYAFNNCCSLASITIPSGVTSINTYAFNNCCSLASITIPSGVTSIGNYVFNYCYSLASITIPSGVTSISDSTFNNCYSLVSITIPSGVTSIGNYVFNYCYSLVSITISSGVTSINTYAFSNCYGMAKYHFLSTTPPTLANTNAFSNIQSDCIIYVPVGSLEAYQTATKWSTYASYMREESA